MTRSLSFVVDGEPVAQGSMMARATKEGRAYLHHDNETKVRRWRREIRDAANGRAITAIRQVPLAVTMAFNTRYAPKSAVDGGYAPTAPDLDKLVRSTFDGLQESEVLTNDAQIVIVHASKRYGRPGLAISITDIAPPASARTRLLRLVGQLNALAEHVDMTTLPPPVVAGLTYLIAYQGEPE